MGEEKRHQMMQNLFGDQSEEEEEIDSEHESNPHPNYASDEAEGGREHEVEGEGEGEGQGDAELESDGEHPELEPDPGESEGEREQSSQEVDVGDKRVESEARDSDSDNKEEKYEQRVATVRRHDATESGSESSEDKRFNDYEDQEVDQARSPGNRSPGDEKDEANISQSAAEIRDVFGDSEDEDAEEYAVRNDNEQEDHRFAVEDEEGSEKDLRPEDIVPDEDVPYESEEEHVDAKKEKPVGPPLEIEVPMRPPPGVPAKMNLIKVSNIMGIDPKPFDPKTFVEEDTFVTDESGSKRRIRLENNIVRYRLVKNRDGTTSYESNARFVRWSDGSLQLLIGNEVLDISGQDAQHDQTHLFLRHGKGILQSQGRIMKKMKFMPSSLTSKSHRLLTALVDSRHKKVYKVKNCFTNIDPEREKEEKEKAENQNIRANLLLSRKKEKVSRKYTHSVERRRLSTGYLEEALDEDEETEYHDSHRSRRFEEELEVEALRERRIMNAKKNHRDISRRPSTSSVKPSRRPVEFSESEREESEYETDGEEEERSPPRKRVQRPEDEYEEEAEEDEEEEEHEEEANINRDSEEEEAEEPKQEKEQGNGRKRKGIESDEEESPPRKAPAHRRMAIVYDSDED